MSLVRASNELLSRARIVTFPQANGDDIGQLAECVTETQP
jgi:hypothetical protein